MNVEPPVDRQSLAACEFLRGIQVHDRLASTNDHVLEILAQSLPPLPLLVVAEEQGAGRGRGGNSWWSQTGGLTFSLVMDRESKRFPEGAWGVLSLLTGWAVGRALTRLECGDVRLKWPNDVFLNGRKVCGILIESSLNQPQAMVVGIGINANNSLAEASPELQRIATSIRDVQGAPVDRTQLLSDLLEELEACLLAVGDPDFSLADTWRPWCLLEGRTVCVRCGNRETVGVCQGIDDAGALLLHQDAGIVRCVAGSVTVL